MWLKSCWAEIPSSLHSKSFKHSGISNALDGTERTLINPKIMDRSEISKWITDMLRRGPYSIHDHDPQELRELINSETTYDLIHDTPSAQGNNSSASDKKHDDDVGEPYEDVFLTWTTMRST
jgi:hypothetical protein